MPEFSKRSLSNLKTCNDRLQWLFKTVVQHFDCTIIEGHRNAKRQNLAVERGDSQVAWPNSKHNSNPSQAVDVVAYPIDWGDRERQTLFAGFVMGVACASGIKLRWGGDWNRDTQVKDNDFDDLVHFEIVD